MARITRKSQIRKLQGAKAPAPKPRPAGGECDATRAMLDLSRELAEARAEDQLSAAVARAMEAVFPGRAFSIRLVDPRSLALTTFHAQGRLRPGVRGRLALRRDAVAEAGLSPAALAAGGVLLVDRDEPLFEGCGEALVVPLAASGGLFGVIALEYRRGGEASPEEDAPLLRQLAGHAALGVRNVRSIEELTFVRTYLDNLLEHANALIFAVDRERAVIVWNAALVKLTGLSAADVLGGEALLRASDDERARLAEVLARSLAGERMDGFETRLGRREGGEVRVSFNTAPIVGASGEVDGVILIGQDQTLLRSVQAAAEHAERLAAIGRLVAGVVHELNNPLTAVTMYSDVLYERFVARGQDPADVEKVRAIRDAGLRIQRLARDLVTYARPAGVGGDRIDLGPVLDEAIRAARPALEEAGARLVRGGEEGLHVVEGTRAGLEQVAVALITNAAQAVAHGGTVEVTVARDGSDHVLTVKDDGSGMPPDVEARAFEPFFTTRPGVGVGLGLPIVQGILERLGGKIALETATGRGTTVTVRLPARHASAGELRTPGKDRRGRAPGDSPTHPRTPKPSKR